MDFNQKGLPPGHPQVGPLCAQMSSQPKLHSFNRSLMCANKNALSIWYVQGSIHSRRRVNAGGHKSLDLKELLPLWERTIHKPFSLTRGLMWGYSRDQRETRFILAAMQMEMQKQRTSWVEGGSSIWVGHWRRASTFLGSTHCWEAFWRESSTKWTSPLIFCYHWCRGAHEPTVSSDIFRMYEARTSLSVKGGTNPREIYTH